jgi:hypothetical protein
MNFRQWYILVSLVGVVVQSVHSAPASADINDAIKTADNNDVIEANIDNGVTTAAGDIDEVKTALKKGVITTADNNGVAKTDDGNDVIKTPSVIKNGIDTASIKIDVATTNNDNTLDDTNVATAIQNNTENATLSPIMNSSSSTDKVPDVIYSTTTANDILDVTIEYGAVTDPFTSTEHTVPETMLQATSTTNYDSGKDYSISAVNPEKSAKNLVKNLLSEDKSQILDAQVIPPVMNKPTVPKDVPPMPTKNAVALSPAITTRPGLLATALLDSSPSLISLVRPSSQQFSEEKFCETPGKCLPQLNSTITCFVTYLG